MFFEIKLLDSAIVHWKTDAEIRIFVSVSFLHIQDFLTFYFIW